MLMLMLRGVHYLGRTPLGRRRLRIISPDPNAALFSSTMIRARDRLFGTSTL